MNKGARKEQGLDLAGMNVVKDMCLTAIENSHLTSRRTKSVLATTNKHYVSSTIIAGRKNRQGIQKQ